MILYDVTVAQNESDPLDQPTTQKCSPFGFEPKSRVLLIVMTCPLSSSDSQIGTWDAPAYKCQQRWHAIWDASRFYEEILNLSKCLSNNSLYFQNGFHPSNLKYFTTKYFVVSEEQKTVKWALGHVMTTTYVATIFQERPPTLNRKTVGRRKKWETVSHTQDRQSLGFLK